MASCNNCGSTILFGGKKAGKYRFCSEKCLSSGGYILIVDEIPNEIIAEHAKTAHEGTCPECNKQNGPVDVHTAHKIWSAGFLTSWVSNSQVSCRSCGIKSQIIGTLYSLFLGWWGFPWGIIMTPVQIIKNIGGIIFSPDPTRPSEKLKHIIKINLGKHIYMQQQDNKNT